MTAEVEYLSEQPKTIEPARMADGGRMIVRGTFRLIGVALTFAAVGLWLAPGSSMDPDIMLFKLILSISAALAGLAMVSASARPPAPEVEIDTIRREVRLVRRLKGEDSILLQRCKFEKLAQVERRGSIVRLWDQGGAFLAEVSLTDRAALNSLVSSLRAVGKLA